MKFLFSLKGLVIVLLVGQAVFVLGSSRYTAPRYVGKIFATVAIEMSERSDLHKLNEAAHYFGQTIIGWTKFPHFETDLKKEVALPADASLFAHLQERQNMVFTVSSSSPLLAEQLTGIAGVLQKKLDQYNAISKTGFRLSNVDYETLDLTRSYFSGAFITFILVGFLWGTLVYLRKI